MRTDPVYRLTIGDWREAVTMWNEGFDTKDIAKALKCPESFIYNMLPIYRDRMSKNAA